MSNKVIQPPFMGLSTLRAITPFSPECLGLDILPLDAVLQSTTNWVANLLVFIPMILAEPFLVSQFFWQNGNAINGNIDAGVYSEDGATKIISTGSTTVANVSAIQVVNVTDTWLPSNRRLWLTLGSDGTTRLLLSALNAALALTYLGVKQQASGWSSGLPSTITLGTPSQARTPLFGIVSGAV